MKISISFMHMEHTPALDLKIREKSEKLGKYFNKDFSVDWVCGVHGNEQWAELKVHGRRSDFFAKANSETLYKAIDVVLDKMERQLEKKKQKVTDKIHADHSNPQWVDEQEEEN
jgi:putative sigma-54 modulation protein